MNAIGSYLEHLKRLRTHCVESHLRDGSGNSQAIKECLNALQGGRVLEIEGKHFPKRWKIVCIRSSTQRLFTQKETVRANPFKDAYFSKI